MKARVIYDSLYGNTEQIARAVAGALGPPEDVEVMRVSNASPEQLPGSELVIIGSPTQGFNSTKPIQSFLQGIPKGALKDVKVAVFDTRMSGKEAGTIARMVTKWGGYAAPRMADAIQKKGGNLIVPPEGFTVTGREGPLGEGEPERAVNWAKKIAEALKAS